MAERHRDTTLNPILNEKGYLKDLLTKNQAFPSLERMSKCTLPNELTENQVGKYKTDANKKIVTTDLEVINEFIESEDKELPYFHMAGPREHLYRDPTNLRVGIVNSGGVAPGLNCVINSIVNRHNKYGLDNHVEGGKGVWGIKESFLGASSSLINDFIIPLTTDETEKWLSRGGSLLGMRRTEVNPQNPDESKKELAEKIVKNITDKKFDILYIIGGNGTLSTANEIAVKITKSNSKVQIVGVPKTMDNDVFWVSESFGFKTAVENSAHIINTLNDESEATRRLCLIELFGAESGFVAANAAIASGHVDLVLIPEDFSDLDRSQCEEVLELYLIHLKTQLEKTGEAITPYANVVLAEGIAQILEDKGVELNGTKVLREDPNTKEKLFLGQFKNYIKEKHWKVNTGKIGSCEEELGIFFNRPDYYIRATAANSNDQIFCDALGSRAVDSALAGFTNFMISEWHNSFVLVPLELVANRTRKIDPNGAFWKQVISNTRQPPNPYHNTKNDAI